MEYKMSAGRKKEDPNIVYTCPDHGEEMYFTIKNNPKVTKDYIYCYFPQASDGVHEKMWVKITKGDREKGIGLLENEPAHSDHLQLHDVVKFYTDENEITYAEKLTN
jgi:hypothetical protein